MRTQSLVRKPSGVEERVAVLAKGSVQGKKTVPVVQILDLFG